MDASTTPTHFVFYDYWDAEKTLFVKRCGSQTKNDCVVSKGSEKECRKYVLDKQRTGGRCGPEQGAPEEPIA
jgi:hypothetical protein